MTKNASNSSSEKPLLGAVLCCTSIAPEERSLLAEYAEQMGAEHKLDLTSDVTHLLVGSTDTPKYQYVAREREDVKVLRPAWIQAVRELWMEDRAIDMNTLEAEHRVPAFAGLKICITGFDDLNVRAEIANTVRKNGGEYTGDLTKDVTHLIAAEPAGKKFEYATVWQKKVVSLKWYHETLLRLMQLDESKYHPSMPLDLQGLGAWNRQRKTDSVVGKRLRDTLVGVEPARKLRRTASSRLGSQTDSMLGEIVRRNNPIPIQDDQRDALRPSKSMPAMNQTELGHRKDPPDGLEQSGNVVSKPAAFLTGRRFSLHGFDPKKQLIVLNTLKGLGADVVESPTDSFSQSKADPGSSFLMVPYQSRQSELPSYGESEAQPTVVTELWLERCMMQKTLISTQDYPLGGLITRIRDADITTFVINATGFASIETLHISKAVKIVGAQYEEMFTPKSSVLICKAGSVNESKLFHARQWKIPAVNEQWLWRFLTNGSLPKFADFLIQDEPESSNDLHMQFKRNRGNEMDGRKAQADEVTVPELPSENSGLTSFERKPPPQEVNIGANTKTGDTRETTTATSISGVLNEISPNYPFRKSPQPNKTIHPIDREATTANKMADPRQLQGSEISPTAKRLGVDNESMNLAIQDLLNIKARARTAQNAVSQDGLGMTKKRLLGRALSNLSNSSHTSQRRLSRASSIDSLNTDGVGSELAPPSGNSQFDANHPASRSIGLSLVGRAGSSTRPSFNHDGSASIALSDPNLCRDEYVDTATTPQLTQLGYEDSDEAIALRERLAEKRRAKARLGQKPDDPAPAVQAKDREGTKRRVIKDDETVLVLEGQAGWGGGRRTRRRDRESSKIDVF